MRTTAELAQAIRSERRVALIVNDYSRHGAPFFERAYDELTRRGYTVALPSLAHDSIGLHEAVRQAIRGGITLIVVGGGDGTISTVVDEFVYQDAVLGILPLGTGNSFARSVGIPLTLQGALDVITEGRVAEADLGRIGEKNYFANVADIGITVAMTRKTTRRLKHYLGKLSYALVGLYELWHHRSFLCRLILDGTRHVTVHTHAVLIANGSSFGTMQLSREATIDDGRFVVATMDETGRWQFFRDLLGFALGKRDIRHAAHTVYASDVVIETDPPQEVDIDGEKSGYTPAHFTIARHALKLMVPQAFKSH